MLIIELAIPPSGFWSRVMHHKQVVLVTKFLITFSATIVVIDTVFHIVLKVALTFSAVIVSFGLVQVKAALTFAILVA